MTGIVCTINGTTVFTLVWLPVENLLKYISGTQSWQQAMRCRKVVVHDSKKKARLTLATFATMMIY